MKKSEALRILGLSDGATDDDIKAAHRKKVVENHPDKFAFGSEEYARAEEKTKLINEARDVLISRRWEPEYAQRGPYAGPYNPYRGGSPSSGGTGWGGPGSAPYGQGGDPFEGWPFGQGQGPWVWTSWEGKPGQNGQPFNPFDVGKPQASPEERKAEARKDLVKEAAVIALKAVGLAVSGIAGALPIGLFFYVVVSVIYGVWKRLGNCLLPFIIPSSLLIIPFLIIIAPRAGSMTFGLIAACLLAFIFDIRNLRSRIDAYRSIKV